MTAGTAATRVETDVSLHAGDATLPFKPRPLTRSERNRREIFVFHSPRNRRVVTVVQILHLASALRFEFDPSLLAYVERPRRIALSPRQEIDISFWTRDRAGEELIRARIAAQIDPDVARARADYVIENDGDLERLRERTKAVYEAILR